MPGPGRPPRRRGGVDDLLHAPDRDVLAADLRDDRDGEPLAQPPLDMRVLAGPLPLHLESVRDRLRGFALRGRLLRRGDPLFGLRLHS
jgi:hypothetical protein